MTTNDTLAPADIAPGAWDAPDGPIIRGTMTEDDYRADEARRTGRI